MTALTKQQREWHALQSNVCCILDGLHNKFLQPVTQTPVADNALSTMWLKTDLNTYAKGQQQWLTLQMWAMTVDLVAKCSSKLELMPIRLNSIFRSSLRPALHVLCSPSSHLLCAKSRPNLAAAVLLACSTDTCQAWRRHGRRQQGDLECSHLRRSFVHIIHLQPQEQVMASAWQTCRA